MDERTRRCLGWRMEQKTAPEIFADAFAGGLNMVRMKRCLCGKMLQSGEYARRWHSGVVNYDEVLCHHCRKEFEDKARIVCLGCRRLQGFLDPHRSTTGFRYEGRRHYHIEKCPKCDPSIVSTAVLEHDRFCRERGVVHLPDKDLVQEIEQKTLQGINATNRLRAEITSRTQ